MAKNFEELVPNAPKGRFDGISRPYTPAEVEKLRGSVPIAYTLPRRAPIGCGNRSRPCPM
jgi:isocitrate lyase